MSKSSLTSSLNELAKLESQLRFMDVLRAAVTTSSSRLGQLEPPICAFTSADLNLLEPSFNKRSDHYLVYATSYAILENYVNDILKSILRFYERSGNYQDLPSPTKTALRVGTARILSRLNWRRFNHISELDVARNYYDSISGLNLKFSDDVIISSDSNYRADEIRSAFRKCGFSDVWNEVIEDDQIVNFLSSTILEDNSTHSILNMLVARRNEVAHGAVKEIDSTDILLEILSFLKVLFQAIFRAASITFLDLIEERVRYRSIGFITQRFRKNIGVATLNEGETLSVLDKVLVRRGGRLVPRIINGIRLDDVDILSCRGSKYIEIGIDFADSVSKGGEIYRLTDDLDYDII